MGQSLDISRNRLHSLPGELSGLQNLKELDLTANILPSPPVSVLSRVTALNRINLSDQFKWTRDESAAFRVPSSLLPIFNPALVQLDLRQERSTRSGEGALPTVRRPWDVLSLAHLGRALADVADRKPVPRLLF